MKAQKRQLQRTEAELIGDGDLDALVTRWWPLIRRWSLMELGNVALAEDASQEAVIRLLRLADTFDTDRAFEPWLRTLVRNCARDVRKRASRRLKTRRREPEWPGFERRMDLGRGADLALKCFANLPERQREIIDLCHHQGLSPKQAAAELGIEPGAARVLLHRSRRALRERLAAHRDELLDLLREP